MYKTISFSIRGISPLLMHSSKLADPLNEHAMEMKKITNKKKDKTDSDMQNHAKHEFLGGIYLNDEKRVILPALNLQACITEGARKKNKGKNFEAGLMIEKDALLEYDGPKDPEELFKNKNFVSRLAARVQKNTVMRTRPIFKAWSCTVEVLFLENVIKSEKDIREALVDAGSLIGIGDYTPRFGRFLVS